MSFDIFQGGLLEGLPLAQSEPEGLLRGLLQLLLLLAFFGLPVLGRRSENKKKQKAAQQMVPPTRASGSSGESSGKPDEKQGRDLWKDLMSGLEQVSEKVEGQVEETRKAIDEATKPSAPRASTARPQGPGAGRGPLPTTPNSRVRPTTQLAPQLRTGLSKILSEDHLESGLSLKDRMAMGGSAEEALERGADLERERFLALPSGLGAAGVLTGSVSRVVPGLTVATELSLFGRRIDAADLKRAVVMSEVLGRPIALREPGTPPGSMPN